MPKTISSLMDIQDRYTYFLVDMWGVIHDGHTLFPQALQGLRALKAKGKTVLFLTNAPRLGPALAMMIHKMGIMPDLYAGIQSSGDTAVTELKTSTHPLYGLPFYFIGQEPLHASLLDAMHPYRVPDISQAQFILMSAVMPDAERIIQQALERKLPLVCANPDRVACEKGQLHTCPGELGALYLNTGGHVFHYGKPYKDIYTHAFKKLGNPPRDQVIAVGDGLHTDILGANTFGIDSVFIRKSGIEKDTTDMVLIEWFKQEHMNPTYVLDEFC